MAKFFYERSLEICETKLQEDDPRLGDALNNLAGKPMIDKFGGPPLAVTLSYLDQTNKATILASPRVVVQDGEEASFENATRVPYISATTSSPYASPYGYRQTTPINGNQNQTTNPYYGYGGYYGNANHVEFVDVGTILRVAPRVTEDENVLLDISAEDSSYKDKEIKAYDQTSTVPEKTSRVAETQLRIHTGDTVVLGGLRRDRAANSVTKTPLLGDVPLLGRLFRNPDKSSSRSSLMVFITTTIVDEYTHPEVEVLAKAEDSITTDARNNERSLVKRLKNRLNREIGVSIGQTGNLHSNGKRVTVEDLRKIFNAKESKDKVVVIRRHPRAPEEPVTEVTEAAMEANLKVEHDDSIPLIPAYHDEIQSPEESVTPEEKPQAAAPEAAPAAAPAREAGK